MHIFFNNLYFLYTVNEEKAIFFNYSRIAQIEVIAYSHRQEQGAEKIR